MFQGVTLHPFSTGHVSSSAKVGLKHVQSINLDLKARIDRYCVEDV